MAISVVCRPLLHPWSPRSHHTLCPRSYWSTPPLVPPALYHLPPASHHHCCRLDQRNTQITIVLSGNMECLTGSCSTVHFIGASNTVLYAVTHKGLIDTPLTIYINLFRYFNSPEGTDNISTSANSICAQQKNESAVECSLLIVLAIITAILGGWAQVPPVTSESAIHHVQSL